MNASRTYRRRNMTAKPFPNAADPSYHLGRLADTMLCAASCAGMVAILFFLITM